MLTEIPVKDWENCEAVPSTLSALAGVVVPGQPRKVETVFVVKHLQCLGLSSVKSESDDWILTSCKRCKRASSCSQHPGEKTEERLAVRLTLADANSQCTVMLYHDLLLKVAAAMDVSLQEPLKDTKELRASLTDMFRNAQWTCRFTFKENEFQNILELECRHIRPSLRLQKKVLLADPVEEGHALPSCRLNNGCPVAPLQKVQVDSHLGLVSVGCMDATFLRGLVRFNQVKLPDDESLHSDNSSTSAMRVKRSFDCLLSHGSTSPFQVKLRMAGPSSVVNWLLQGRAGEVHQVVLAHTDVPGEWSVLWQVPVEETAVELVTEYFRKLAATDMATKNDLEFDVKWTPVKRLHCMRTSMPPPARSSQAWSLPDLQPEAETQPDDAADDEEIM